MIFLRKYTFDNLLGGTYGHVWSWQGHWNGNVLKNTLGFFGNIYDYIALL